MMRYANLLEGRNSKVIVVDVQPAYPQNDFDVEDLMEWLNRQGQILMFVNAEDTGLTEDTIEDVKYYWMEHGYNEDRWSNTEIVDKGYGYLRSWMDYQEHHGGSGDNRVVIQTIRQMYAQKVTSSEMLFDQDRDRQEEFLLKYGVDSEDVDYYLDDSIHVEWASVGQLKRYSGAYLVGGGRNECLKEVALLMNSFNIRYRTVNDFIYG